jgi:hypothetical protein
MIMQLTSNEYQGLGLELHSLLLLLRIVEVVVVGEGNGAVGGGW